jgi:hypothetical protein
VDGLDPVGWLRCWTFLLLEGYLRHPGLG